MRERRRLRRFGASIFLLMSFAGIAHSQIITTVVGGQQIPFSTTGLQALRAPLAGPVGLAVDHESNLLIADNSMQLVLRLSPGGVLTVVAGNGASGFSGDGGPATSAMLNRPSGVAVDQAGNIYIADMNNFRIRVVAPNGTIRTTAGGGISAPTDGGSATSAMLGFAQRVAVDTAGNLFVLEWGSGDIRKVSPDGTLSLVVSGLSDAAGLAVDTAGNLYFAESSNNRVRKRAPDGTVTTVAGTGGTGYSGDGGPATGALLSSPSDVAIDAGGSLYIADRGNGRIRRVTPAGIISTVAGGGPPGTTGDGGPATNAALNNPESVGVDTAGNFYIGFTSRVRKVSAAGIITTVASGGDTSYVGDGGPAISTARLSSPGGLAFDGSGNLYIADNHRIRRVTPDGIITTAAGNGQSDYAGDGGPATSASLASPFGICVDAAGNLYIGDSNRVRKVASNGIISTVAGGGYSAPTEGGPATKAYFGFTFSVVLGAAGQLYFIDSDRVWKLTPAGTVSSVAGTGTAGTSGDGGPAISAQLNEPRALAMDSGGNLYIAEGLGRRVRMVNPSGAITTVAGNGTRGDSGDGGPATSAQFMSPIALALDTSGDLYIADDVAGRVRKVTRSGIISTVAGGRNAGATDGGLATYIYINPAGLAVDATGNLYISDPIRDCVWKVTAETYTGGSRPVPTSVGNAADYNPLIAPSTWITIVGTNLAPTTRSWTSADLLNSQLPVQLDGVRVFVQGMPAYPSYISPTQINALVGALAPLNGAAFDSSIEILTPQGRSSPIAVNADSTYAPGFFRLPVQGNKYVLAQAQDGSLIGEPGLVPGLTTRPARPGEILTIYGTGLGPTDPPVAPGTVSASPAPLAGWVLLETDSGADLRPIWAGLIGPGLYQVNFQVPVVPDGDFRLRPRAGFSYGLDAWITIQAK